MLKHMEPQSVSAAPRCPWVTPELRSLDVRKTLNGPIAWYAEEPIIGGGTGQHYGDGHCDPAYAGICPS